MNKILIWLSIIIGAIIIIGIARGLYSYNVNWKTQVLKNANGQAVVSIKYPVKFQKSMEKVLANNASSLFLQNGQFQVPSDITFSLSSSPNDLNIDTFTNLAKKLAAQDRAPAYLPTSAEYTTSTYGRNKAYFVKNSSLPANYRAAELFDGKGNHLSFAYNSDNVTQKDAEQILTDIKFK